ncbi:MAG TPA: glyoxalase [Cyanobacteria bacterium UBA11369]|nr:glyoxalase [Cyanobacteria bacterium UBA11371]HBE33361.1 glyoxalase [Cyanobacteria bacterium UBA11368]HBE54002.1 glyoxalase [Cyanobacteria bacterium UBA11369]
MVQCTDAFVTLASVDVERLVKFYSELLGKNPQNYIHNAYAEFHLPGLRLGIFKPRETHRQEFEGKRGSMSLCLEVKDLEDTIAHLTAIGYPAAGEIITASHGREIYAYDPDGNRLILHQSPRTDS